MVKPGGRMSGSERVKTELRLKLARRPYEEKIRKVGQLVQLSSKMKAQRIGEDAAPLTGPKGRRGQSTKC